MSIPHTPGPFKIQNFRDGARIPVGPNDFFTAGYATGGSRAETKANARLFAAAPTMHLQLEAALEELSRLIPEGEWEARGVNAIAQTLAEIRGEA